MSNCLSYTKTKKNNKNQSITPRDAVDAIEKALCSKQRVVLGHVTQKASQSLLIKDIARAADIEIPNDISGTVTLRELGMNPFRLEAVQSLFVNNYQGTDTTNYQLSTSRTHLCVVPGIEGHHNRFMKLGERLKVPAVVVQHPLKQNKMSIREDADNMIKILFKQQLLKDNFILLGYEKGVLVALEMASILESYGLTGTVFCLGGTPDEVKAKFEQELSHLYTDEALQEEVIKHLLPLISKKNPENLQIFLQDNLTFEEKISNCIQMLGSVSHSTEYAKEIIQAAYLSIHQIRRYVSNLKPLRSLIVYMRPNDIVYLANDKQYSQQPVINYELPSSLETAAEDLLCSAIVNRHLREEVLKEFEKQNHLETYLARNHYFS